jgi:hypothetical protein
VSSLALGLVLALGASVALNAGFLLQHAGSQHTAAISARRPLATMRALLGSPAWAVGLVAGLLGWAMHVAALSFAPLSLVQAFVAGGLALTVPMAAIGLGHRVGPGETRAALAMVAALVLLAVGLHGAHRGASFGPAGLAVFLAALALPAAVLCATAKGPRRPVALGLAGGLLYGAADLSIKAMTGAPSLAHALLSPWAAAAAAVTAAAFFAFQRGLQTGGPVVVIAIMTAATNIGSILGGFVVFGDSVGPGAALGALHAAGFALVVAAAWRLAPSQAALTAGTA